MLRIEGKWEEKAGEFLVAVGKRAHDKHRLRAGMELSDLATHVDDARLEAAGFYKTSRIKGEKGAEGEPPGGPPFLGVLPDLPTYRTRGHRRLDARSCQAKYATCMWGCVMPVELIVDHWDPSLKKHRYETFCYGPKNRPLGDAFARTSADETVLGYQVTGPAHS